MTKKLYELIEKMENDKISKIDFVVEIEKNNLEEELNNYWKKQIN